MQHTYKIRAALFVVIAVAAVAAFAGRAQAATGSRCQPNPYTAAGRTCIDRQIAAEEHRAHTARLTAARKPRHNRVKKQSPSSCPVPYVGLRC